MYNQVLLSIPEAAPFCTAGKIFSYQAACKIDCRRQTGGMPTPAGVLCTIRSCCQAHEAALDTCFCCSFIFRMIPFRCGLSSIVAPAQK